MSNKLEHCVTLSAKYFSYESSSPTSILKKKTKHKTLVSSKKNKHAMPVKKKISNRGRHFQTRSFYYVCLPN